MSGPNGVLEDRYLGTHLTLCPPPAPRGPTMAAGRAIEPPDRFGLLDVLAVLSTDDGVTDAQLDAVLREQTGGLVRWRAAHTLPRFACAAVCSWLIEVLRVHGFRCYLCDGMVADCRPDPNNLRDVWYSCLRGVEEQLRHDNLVTVSPAMWSEMREIEVWSRTHPREQWGVSYATSRLEAADPSVEPGDRELVQLATVLLRERFAAEGATDAEWRRASGLPDRTFYNRKRDLLERGWIAPDREAGKKGTRFTATLPDHCK